MHDDVVEVDKIEDSNHEEDDGADEQVVELNIDEGDLWIWTVQGSWDALKKTDTLLWDWAVRPEFWRRQKVWRQWMRRSDSLLNCLNITIKSMFILQLYVSYF